MGSLHDSLPVPSLTSNELTFAVEETMMDSAVSKDTQKKVGNFLKEHMTDVNSLQERNRKFRRKTFRLSLTSSFEHLVPESYIAVE